MDKEEVAYILHIYNIYYIYIYNGVLGIKTTETGSFVAMWMNLESVIQSKLS